MDVLRLNRVVWILALLALSGSSLLPQTRQFSASAYGGLYEDNPGGSVITVVTGGNFYQWTTATTGPNHRGVMPAGDPTATLTVDPGSGGVYLVAFDVSFVASVAENIHWHAYLNGNAIVNVSTQVAPTVKIEINAAANGLVRLAAGDVMDLRVTAVSDGTTVTVSHVSLVIVKVS